MENGFQAVPNVFALLAVGALALVGLNLLVEWHLLFIQLALSGGLVVLTIGAAISNS